MATKDDFTEDEWNALELGVVGAGMFVSVSEPDFTHTISETNASRRTSPGTARRAGASLSANSQTPT